VTLPVKRLATIVRELPKVDVSFGFRAAADAFGVRTASWHRTVPRNRRRRRRSQLAPRGGQALDRQGHGAAFLTSALTLAPDTEVRGCRGQGNVVFSASIQAHCSGSAWRP